MQKMSISHRQHSQRISTATGHDRGESESVHCQSLLLQQRTRESDTG